MKIAIVGSSHLSETEEMDARKICGYVLNKALEDRDNIPILVSGGAKGVDSIAEDIANQLKIKTIIHKPLENNWENGYKPRNMQIAQECNVLYCLPTGIKTTPCYHCGDVAFCPHEVTGGCWTMKEAKKLKKDTHLVPLI